MNVLVQLFATPWIITSVHGILQARILEWVAIPFSRGSFQARDQTKVSCIAGRFFFFFFFKCIYFLIERYFLDNRQILYV